MHTLPPVDAPKPTDPPFLIAILIGAMRTGDSMTASLARGWLADIGIRIQFAKDAPILSPNTKGGARG